MNKTYISITITYFKGTTPTIRYYYDDGENVISTWNKMTSDEANIKMWELVKLGGKNTYKSNWFNNAISSRNVTFWGRL